MEHKWVVIWILELIIFIINSSQVFVLKTFEINAIFERHNTQCESDRKRGSLREDMNAYIKDASNVHVAIRLQVTAKQSYQI